MVIMRKQITEKIVVVVLALILVLMMIPGTYYDMTIDTKTTVTEFIKGNLSLFLVLFFLLLTACYTMLRFVYKKVDRINESISVDVSYQHMKTVVACWIIIFICWLPYLIICFPASSFGWDYTWQLLQGTGVVPISNHHPVVGSLIYGLLYKIGFIFGGASGGLFFTGLIQVTLMSFAMAYGITTVRRMGCPKKVAWCLLIFTCICPTFAGHAVWLIKDTIYSSLIVILLSLCLNYRLNRDKATYLILIGLIGLLAAMYRSEGIVIVALMYLSVIANTFRIKPRKYFWRIIISFVSVLLLFASLKIGMKISGVPSTSIARESMTILSAQIMDCLKKHPSDLSEHERTVLSKSYADFDNAILKYDEIIRDPIKTRDMNISEVIEYLKTWLKIGARNKGDYIDTFLRGTNGYWWTFREPALIPHTTPLYAPEDDFANVHLRDTLAMNHKWLKEVYKSYGIETDKTIGELVLENNPDVEGIFYVKSSFPDARNSINGLLGKLKKIPLLQFIFVPGFYFAISLLSMGYLFIRKRTLFWQCLPIVVIVIFNCISPVNGYMRYFLPIALSSLLIMGLCFTGKRNSTTGKDLNE